MRNVVKEILNKLPKADKASGDKQILCRCIYCGDSKSEPDARSMGISIPQTEDDPMLFQCFRANCGAKGLVDEDTLIEWGIYNQESLKEIIQHNKNFRNNSKKRKSFKIKDDIIYVVKNNNIEDNKFTEKKLEYLNKRLGTEFTIEDCKKLKIVLNIGDLLHGNNINKYTRGRDVMRMLHSDYIGFLSMDNGMINLRDITDKNQHRYINYTIFNNTTPNKFYIIPNNVDIDKPVHIHITEGIFDILSVYENLNIKNHDNSLCVSVFGATYTKVIKWFAVNSGINEIVFHIYIDNDIKKFIYDDIIYTIKLTGNKGYIHRNNMTGEKDYGVSRDRINDTIIKSIE